MDNSNNKDKHNSNHNTHKDNSNTTHKNPTHDNHETKKSPVLTDSDSKKPFSSNTDDIINPEADTRHVKSEDTDAGSTIRSDKGTSDEDELNDTLNNETRGNKK